MLTKATKEFHGVIFDLDGVIVDSEYLKRALLQEIILEQFCLQVPIDAFGWALGLERRAVESGLTTQLTALLGSATPQGLPVGEESLGVWLLREREKRFVARYQQQIPLRPGVVELLSALRDAGMMLGLATNADEKRATPWLASGGILPFFRCTAFGDSPGIAKRKPGPDLYQRAAKQLGVDPQRLFAIEDSPVGITAAVAAGIPTVYLVDLRIAPAQTETASKAQVTCTSIREVQEWLLR